MAFTLLLLMVLDSLTVRIKIIKHSNPMPSAINNWLDILPIRFAIGTEKNKSNKAQIVENNALDFKPEGSDYTSIQERIKSKDSRLLNLGFNESDIGFTLADYCELVDSIN